MKMKHTIVGVALGLFAFTLGSLGYVAMSALGGRAFGSLFRMFLYHEAHPFQYIAVVSIAFGVLGAFWFAVFGGTTGWRRWLSIFATIILTILAASVPGGVLWKIHDMQAGYFPEGSRFWDDLLWGAQAGLETGWLVILFSLPYNLIGFGIAAALLHRLPALVTWVTAKKHKPPCPL